MMSCANLFLRDVPFDPADGHQDFVHLPPPINPKHVSWSVPSFMCTLLVKSGIVVALCWAYFRTRQWHMNSGRSQRTVPMVTSKKDSRACRSAGSHAAVLL